MRSQYPRTSLVNLFLDPLLFKPFISNNINSYNMNLISTNSSSYRLCDNPIVRFSELLLNEWRILHPTVDIENNSLLCMVPVTFHSYTNYILAWEPLMIEEIRENCRNIFITRLRDNIHYHSIVFRILDDADSKARSKVLTISCSITSMNGNSPGPMDTILIQSQQLADWMKTKKQNTNSSFDFNGNDEIKDQYLIGLVTEYSGGQSLKVKVSKNRWMEVRNHFQSVVNIVDDEADKISSQSKVFRKENHRNSKHETMVGVSNFSGCCIIIDHVRSSWREFLAIHELRRNPEMLKEIMGKQSDSSSMKSVNTLSLKPPTATMDSGFVDGSFMQTPPLLGPPSVTSPNLSLIQDIELFATNNENEVMQQNQNITVNYATSAQLGTIITVQVKPPVEKYQIEGLTDAFVHYLISKYNSSQLHAIQTAVTSKGFTLVQGPPGTGKTSTIIGLLNAIHIREYRKYYQHVIDTLLSPKGIKCKNAKDEAVFLALLSEISSQKPRVLVTAPSNVAVDNIIERIMDMKFRDDTVQGNLYNPMMLRVGGGLKRAQKVKVVTMDDMMDSEQLFFDSKKQEVSMEKKAMLTAMNQEIASLLNRIHILHTMLINLKIAFERSPHGLPEGVEVCMNPMTAIPYWYDHINETSSDRVPILTDRIPTGRFKTYPRLDSLPHFEKYCDELLPLMDQLYTCHFKRMRLHVYLKCCLGNASSNEGGLSKIQAKQLIQSSILETTQILFSTLNGTGHPSLDSTEFSVTIVDEAAQCVEPSILIALRRGCKQCIMVGDQKQLPATIFSNAVKRFGYDRSLFERLIQAGHPHIVLNTQYRMHPTINEFPNKYFYDGQLKDGDNVVQPNYLPNYIASYQDLVTRNASGPTPLGCIPPYLFFDLKSSKDSLKLQHEGRLASIPPPMKPLDGISDEMQLKVEDNLKGPDVPLSLSSLSLSNQEEAKLCFQLVEILVKESTRHSCVLGSIGVITPYSEQCIVITQLFSSSKLSTGSSQLDIEVSTVDGFQGKEKDIVIISTVRANELGSIGFLADARRMNVSITRARYGMYIIGHRATLQSNNHWLELLNHSEERHQLVTVESSASDIMDVMHDYRRWLTHCMTLQQQPVDFEQFSLLGKRKKTDVELEEGEVSED